MTLKDGSRSDNFDFTHLGHTRYSNCTVFWTVTYIIRMFKWLQNTVLESDNFLFGHNRYSSYTLFLTVMNLRIRKFRFWTTLEGSNYYIIFFLIYYHDFWQFYYEKCLTTGRQASGKWLRVYRPLGYII